MWILHLSKSTLEINILENHEKCEKLEKKLETNILENLKKHERTLKNMKTWNLHFGKTWNQHFGKTWKIRKTWKTMKFKQMKQHATNWNRPVALLGLVSSLYKIKEIFDSNVSEKILRFPFFRSPDRQNHRSWFAKIPKYFKFHKYCF